MRIRFLAAAASLASITLASSAAQAASANDDNTSSANAALSWSTRQTIVGPTSGKLGGSSELQVQVSANLVSDWEGGEIVRFMGIAAPSS